MMTFAEKIVSCLNDRDIMLLLAQVRCGQRDLNEFKEIAAKAISDEDSNYREFLNDKIDETVEDLFDMEEEVADIYYELDIKVDDLDYYPVLFRGKVKPYEWINLSNIDAPSLPINEDGFKTAQLVRGRVPVPPIRLSKFANGRYKVADGRHRFLAFKLNGLEKIPAYVHPSFKEAIEATGNKYNKTFEELAKGPEDE